MTLSDSIFYRFAAGVLELGTDTRRSLVYQIQFSIEKNQEFISRLEFILDIYQIRYSIVMQQEFSRAWHIWAQVGLIRFDFLSSCGRSFPGLGTDSLLK